MVSTMLSRVIGLVRVKYIAWLLGRTAAADAFNAAFQLPDMVSYFLVGGAASITFVSVLSRYNESGRGAEGERTMSTILTLMTLVLGGAILVAELTAPLFVHWWFSGFPAEEAALCVHLTRILLPAQLCFFTGGIFGAGLLVRRVFSVQAVYPLVYNIGIILGGVLLAHAVGVSALAFGALAGAFCGPFLLNAIGAHRVGMRYRPVFEWSNPGLLEWVRMSIPLMLGVSLVTADNWIINYFASHVGGTITLMTYAKVLFTAPVALGQAAGAASLPFLASLFTRTDRRPFAQAVNSSVSNIIAFSVLLSSFMVAMAFPIVDVVVRGGAFHRNDSGLMSGYFAIFSISLCFWSAQAIYARAFYAAGNTVTPMIAGTVITAISIPLYWVLYRSFGPAGLAVASDVGILFQTSVLACLLHTRGMVSLRELEYVEILRSVLAGAFSFLALTVLHLFVHPVSRLCEVGLLCAAAVIWFGVSFFVLRLSGSSLPNQIVRRFSAA